ncbi:MAG: hypothetical protein ABFR33_11320 [Verrucomicrobiota bacterium]
MITGPKIILCSICIIIISLHEGSYVAEIDMEPIEQETGWSPYLSLDDLRIISCNQQARIIRL